MLPKQWTFFRLMTSKKIVGFVLLLLAAVPAYAEFSSQFPSPQDMINNLIKQLPLVTKMVTAIAYVLGFYFIMNGILKLKQYGEQRTMMSSEHSLMGPLMYLVAGTLLIYLPTSVEVGLSTFWTEPNPYGYQDQTDQWGDFMKNIYIFVQFIGVLAFIRGLVLLSHLGKHSQQGTFGKAITHIIGGILCINMYQTVQVILATFGITQS